MRNYLILENLPFDQYVAVNPDWLFGGESETAIVDKNNLLIELAHIRAAAAEMPLTLDDIALFPDLGGGHTGFAEGKGSGQPGRKVRLVGRSVPGRDFSLRNIDKARYKLIIRKTAGKLRRWTKCRPSGKSKDGIYA
ncbi:MAG: hypothetical protein ACLUOI_00075 [Eisenbergiella sp.]